MMSHNAERHARGDEAESGTPTQHPGVMVDVASAAPPPSRPIDDVLLTDMDWAALTAQFPAARIHADVCAGEEALFAVNEWLRTFALLPVKRWCVQSGVTVEKWVVRFWSALVRLGRISPRPRLMHFWIRPTRSV
jgi:hypothetical protein